MCIIFLNISSLFFNGFNIMTLGFMIIIERDSFFQRVIEHVCKLKDRDNLV